MKITNKEQQLFIEHVKQLDEEKVLDLAGQLLNAGMNPLDLLDLVNQGMNQVGRLYESRDYYIADLIMAGLIFRQILELDQMSAHFRAKHLNKIGKVVLGTVEGDIHDIGKDIFRGMLEANGFEVIDLGVDVSKELFIKKVNEYEPCILGLSGVLTTTVETMKEVVMALKNAGLSDKVKIIVGGNHLTGEVAAYIGADSFANDALVGVKICQAWVGDTASG